MAAFRHISTARARLGQRILPLAIAASFLALGSAHAQSSLPDGVSATVNGEPIYTDSVETVLKQFETNNQPVDEARVLDEIINMQVLTQQAEKMEIDKDPEVAAALKLQYVQTMANAYLAKVAEDIEVSEEELRAMYDEQVAAIKDDEFRASHILLETKEDADEVLKLLGEGRDFAELAREMSVDPAGANGGDLGWFQKGAMVDEFYDAAKEMEVGAVSAAPVKTEFGYHIIQLIDKRGGTAPDYETVKPGMTNLATRAKMNEIMDNLISEADIVR